MRAFDKHSVGRDRQYRRWLVTLRQAGKKRNVLVSAPDEYRAINTALHLNNFGERKDATARLATAADWS